ncbi:conjugal transfer protein TraG N-terminal domain-containing protein [Burkholderia cenocepacia]|uniref:conjugal transfer protein TraG N-terminal domain-containing protein n=1 Tax=Burkholderia cenocepacia TaxID=95486 RepID=UPI0023B9D580|nr:conjugal transfer protein TraG N-terminal domain-containing protein [Burkholderia cenocepacia]MDF0506644.1 conjugal transfer protein TraG N-terminal domain-containing protein [Burkholderia cenocepacia]
MAIPTLTIYSATADPTTLRAIFDAVAMICKNNLMIWGFAVMVALWRLSASTAVASLRSASGQGGTTLGNGALSAMMPFVLATVLTNPMLKSTVQIESTVNGSLTQVDNVPLAVSIIPVAGSILSTDLNDTVSTAFQRASAEYPTISASSNGFLNPLKALLNARTATSRLSGIDSEVKTVLAACLGPDSGVNYSNIQRLVMNAGNTGATSSLSIPVNGVNPTAIGALLYQASLNSTGKVNDIGLDSTNILSCSDAAYRVADDITNALNSLEFPRVMQGAVNGLDAPRPGADYSFSSLASQYYAVSRANTLGGVFAGGTGQANAEFMNLLFSEMVQGDLNCLRAAGDTLIQCQASVLQAAEVERNNLQAAASEIPAMRYAGAFGNYLIALIIGLGPVIIMLMMFAGIEAGKSVKTAAHIIVWPLLVNNVGAEIVNGMISIDIANFLQALRQGGWLSQATTYAAYKELSLQIGVGSHIMASLPVLMSIIFSLGESSAMTSVASTISPRSKETVDNVAPAPQVTRPMFEGGPVGTISQLGHGAGKLAMTGSVDAVSTSMNFGNMARDASRSLTQSEVRSQNISAGESNLAEFRRAFSTGDFSRLNIDRQVGQTLAENFNKELRSGSEQHTGSSVTGLRSNSNRSTVGAGGSASLSLKGGGNLGAGAHADTSTSADDSLQRTGSNGASQSYSDSVALSNALSKTMAQYSNTSAGKQSSAELSRALSTQRSYQQTLSEVSSVSDAATQAVRDSSGFISMSGKIGSEEIAWQQRANPEYASFQMKEGRLFEENRATRPYLQTAAADAASGSTGRLVGDRSGQAAINRHRAAVMLAQDENARPEDRMAASRYLAEEARAMQHMKFDPTSPAPMNLNIGSPRDATGVKGSEVARFAQRHLPAPATAPTMASRPGLDGGTTIPSSNSALSSDVTSGPSTGSGQGTVERGGTPIQRGASPSTAPRTLRSSQSAEPKAEVSTTQGPSSAPVTGGEAPLGTPGATVHRGGSFSGISSSPTVSDQAGSANAGDALVAATGAAPGVLGAQTPTSTATRLTGQGTDRRSDGFVDEARGVPSGRATMGVSPSQDTGPGESPSPTSPLVLRNGTSHASGAQQSADEYGRVETSPLRNGSHLDHNSTPVSPDLTPATRQASVRTDQAETAPERALPHTRSTNAPSAGVAPPPAPQPVASLNADFETQSQELLAGRREQVATVGRSAETQSSAAGLDAKGHGTMIRAAANVGDNLADVGRSSGAGSRTGLAARGSAAPMGSPAKRVRSPANTDHPSPGPQPAPNTKRSTPQAAPAITPPVPQQPAGFGADFEKQMREQLASRKEHVTSAVQSAEVQASNAGLDAKGHGTMIRTAANVGDNVMDIGRSAGSASRTGLSAPQEPKKAREPAAGANPDSTPGKRGN